MAIDFPNSPVSGDLYTAGGKTWQWNGTYWAAYGTGPVLRTSDTAPVSPNAGDLWYETDTGRFFTYIDSFWVEIGSPADVLRELQPSQVTALSAVTSLTSDDIFPVVDGPSGAVAVSKITADNLASQLAQFAPQTSFRNKIINGSFDINQRGLNSTGTTTTGTYGFDRWTVAHIGGTCTQSAQTFTVGSPAVADYESSNYLQFVTESQSGVLHFAKVRQFIEDVRTFAGATVTVSFWAKATSGTPKIAVELNQNFGTGGSPSAEVNVYGGQVTLSTSWTRYSVTVALPNLSSKIIGTTANTSSLIVDFWTSAGATYNTRSGSLGIQNTTVHFWGVQVERGSVATPFEQRPIGTELALCQRYYFQITPETLGDRFGMGYGVSANQSIRCFINFPVQLRAEPTAVIVSSAATDYSVVTGSLVTVCSTLPAFAQATRVSGDVQFNVASGIVDAGAYMARTNSLNALLAWSVEL